MNNKKGFLGPLPICMVLSALFVDVTGMLLVIFGLDDFGVLDILGLVIVGGLTYLYTGSISSAMVSQGKSGKGKLKGVSEEKGSEVEEGGGIAEKGASFLKKKFLKKLGLTTIIEIIPYIGAISPTWLILVYRELKNK